LRHHLSEAGRGVELDAGHRRQRVTRQHRAVGPDQREACAGARGKRSVKAFEGLRRHRDFGQACESAGTVGAPFADGKDQPSRHLDADDFADVNARIRRQLRLQIGALGRVDGGRNRKEQRRYQRIELGIQDPDRTDIRQGGNELL
jgi:hypothetical protein